MTVAFSRCDMPIRGGPVIDGTGPGETDASGRVVRPGFIDMRTDDDRAPLSEPGMGCRTGQGCPAP